MCERSNINDFKDSDLKRFLRRLRQNWWGHLLMTIVISMIVMVPVFIIFHQLDAMSPWADNPWIYVSMLILVMLEVYGFLRFERSIGK